MLHLIKDYADNFFNLINEDPVRPHIPHHLRIGNNKDIFVLEQEKTAEAITCVSYQVTVPASEIMLFETCDLPTTAVFYTIWSYKAGKGRQLILDSVNYILQNKPSVNKFVTLSPKTEMARKFHLRNGAKVLRENKETINYEYELK